MSQTTFFAGSDRLVSDVIEQAMAKYPENVAFSCMGSHLSFNELDRLSADMASFFQHQLMLRPGDRIALQIPNILQYPIALYGALRAGLVVVSTNPLYTARELRHQLQDSGAKALVVLSNIADVAAKVIADTQVEHVIVTQVGDCLPPIKRVVVNATLKYIKKMVPTFSFCRAVSFRKALRQGRAQPFRPVRCQREDVAILQYTGGTTGVAKGVMLTHANLVSNMEQAYAHLNNDLVDGKEIYVCPLPLYHIYAFTLHCMVLFGMGGRNILIPNPRDIGSFAHAIKGEQVTGFVGINTLFNALCRDPNFRQLDFSSLRVTASGGMALNIDAAQAWESVTGVMPTEGFGMTETSPVIAASTTAESKLGTVGKPLPSTEIKVIDADGNTLKQGETGELCVRGPQVMKGYWNRPEATAEVLDCEGWLKTGDMVVVDNEGFLEIVDRKKEMIIVSGFNVYPTEVEAVACQHPDINEAAMIGVEDSNSGEAVKLFIVRRVDSLTKAQIKDYCREQLTAYKVPKHIEFRQALPKSAVGKILRRELKEAAVKNG
jgi:long-chain acyl-CoA synthetase